MTDKGNHTDNFKNPEIQHQADQVSHKFEQYRTAEGSHDASGIHKSGERLAHAAMALEKTLGNDGMVAELAKAIKEGTPGTKDWDDLMKKVQDTMTGNTEQASAVKEQIGKTTKDLAQVGNTMNAGNLLGNVTLTG
jgi:hypothetical protein